jgi:hypothetical protein
MIIFEVNVEDAQIYTEILARLGTPITLPPLDVSGARWRLFLYLHAWRLYKRQHSLAGWNIAAEHSPQ